MKVYQLIYTSVKCSLSDPELGLTNGEGLRVFSCTQGLTKRNIEEILRYATYRLPKNDETEYSHEPCSASVPELFPKIFRTLRLSDGRYAAIQVSYAGYDFDGKAGNVFAHAFVFEDVDDSFLPEQYFGHPLYRTHLNENEINGKIVHYMKPLDDIKPSVGLDERVTDFIGYHKNELSYIMDKAIDMLSSNEIKNICIATEDCEQTQMYLLALKWILPRGLEKNMGISTYNVYLPSDKQRQIVFHGTVKGRNNITDEAVMTRENCLYIDVEKTSFKRNSRSVLYRFTVGELREIYGRYKFTSAAQLAAWEATWENTTKTGIAGRLIKLRKAAGDEAFRMRVMELYPAINDIYMNGVRFELSKIMFDNIHLFESERRHIVELYMGQCLDKICSGETLEIGNPFEETDSPKEIADEICAEIGQYVETIRINYNDISDKNKRALLEMFGHLKHAGEKRTWKEMFTNSEDLKLFVLLSSQVLITGSGLDAFSSPDDWEKSDMAELVAYYESSTSDAELKKSCVKYICSNRNEDWESYGVTIKSRPKSPEEREKDIEKVRRMLSKVGFIPYQRSAYTSIKGDVMEDIRGSNSPLLVSRLLRAIYRWQGTYGSQMEAEKQAKNVRELLMELRKAEISCYNYMIPKLALEIIESPGHCHEIMVNVQTMPASFWDWFIIGYERCKRDDDKRLAYSRVYEAGKNRMSRIPARKKLRAIFGNDEE